MIALVRGSIATLLLYILSRFTKNKADKDVLKKNMLLLVLSGAGIGFNWILFFEAQRHTTVAVATLCYYLAPVFIILLSPIALKEKLTLKKSICVAIALVGMIFVSGVLEGGGILGADFKGVLFGISAAGLYAIVVIMNKKLVGLGGFDRTLFQMGFATLALIPYVLLTQWGTPLSLSVRSVILLLILGVLHTGICYAMYFSALKELPAQTSSILSYIDPVSAIIFANIFLHESLSIFGTVGAVLILRSMLVSEINLKRKNKKDA
jgi:RarD protein